MNSFLDQWISLQRSSSLKTHVAKNRLLGIPNSRPCITPRATAYNRKVDSCPFDSVNGYRSPITVFSSVEFVERYVAYAVIYVPQYPD